MIRLVDVDERNWLEVRALSVGDGQEGFLDTSLGIMARGYVYRDCRARVIGIADGSIDAVGSSIEGVVMDLLSAMEADDADTMTLLAGEDYSDEALEALVERIEGEFPDLEVDAQRGDQPLYPVVFSLE